MRAIVVLLVACFLLNASFCPSQGKWKVAVVHSGSDMLGEQLAYKVKERMNKSSLFDLVSEDNATLIVKLATIDIPCNNVKPNSLSGYSMIFIAPISNEGSTLFLNDDLGYFGTLRMEQTVDVVLSGALQVAEHYLGDGLKIRK